MPATIPRSRRTGGPAPLRRPAARALVTSIQGIITGLAGSPVTGAVASGSFDLQPGQVFLADVPKRLVSLRVDINDGAGRIERPVYLSFGGRYKDTSYQWVYVETFLGAGVTIPGFDQVYNTDYTGATDAVHVVGARSNRALPAKPTYGFACELRFDAVRTTTDRIIRVNGTNIVGSEDFGFCDSAGNPPVAWFDNPEFAGYSPAVIYCDDPDYLCNYDPDDPLLPRSLESNAAYSTASRAADNLLHQQRFDSWFRDFYHSGKLNMPAGYRGFSLMDRTRSRGTVWNANGSNGGPDLSLSQNWCPTIDTGPVATGATPPNNANSRYALGNSLGSASDPNFYGSDLIAGREHRKTGDGAYYLRACNYAFWYNWFVRWHRNGTDHVIAWTGEHDYARQPEGQAWYYRNQGYWPALKYLDAIATLSYGDATFGVYGQLAGEPRPMAKYLHATTQVYLCTRPASEGLTLLQGGESQNWLAECQAKLQQSHHRTALQNPAIGNNGYAWVNRLETLTNTPGFNAFMFPQLANAEKTCALRVPVGADLEAETLVVYQAIFDLLWSTYWEEDPSDNPGTVSGTTGTTPNMRNTFDGNPMSQRQGIASYPPTNVDLNAVFAGMPDFLAYQLQDGRYTLMADRLARAAEGYNHTQLDGNQGPYYYAGGNPKPKNEQNMHWQWASVYRSLAPAPVASLATDAQVEVRVAPDTLSTYPTSLGSVGVGRSITLTAKRRGSTRRIIETGSALTVAVTSGGTFGHLSAQAYHSAEGLQARQGSLTMTFTGDAPGVAVVTVTDPDTGMTGPCTITVGTVNNLLVTTVTGSAAGDGAHLIEFNVRPRDAGNVTLIGHVPAVTASSGPSNFTIQDTDPGDRSLGVTTFRCSASAPGAVSITVQIDGVSATFTGSFT